MHETGLGSSTFSQLRVGNQLANGRFTIERILGRGGMGIVYRAFDAQRRGPVALKTMQHADAASIYALKNEFRCLADIHHPHLARLHELFREQDDWFFTMELVDGEHFDRWVRPYGALHELRLRTAFSQLTGTIAWLHGAGKLHRDIKPSNILVNPHGHVVVLDFGLVIDRHDRPIGQTLTDQLIVGTPDYLAPEQAHRTCPSPAADAYALGVMLFQSLTGKLPYAGTAAEVLIAKQQDGTVWPEGSRGAAPQDLVEICDRLLARDPARRPDLQSVHQQFALSSDGREARPTSPAPRAMTLFGRDRELESMRMGFEASLGGQGIVLVVSGESGIGKSALCDAFSSELSALDRAIVLRGRCNERENVLFKAFDLLIDGLSRRLRRMPAVDSAALLPRDADALVQLFPALARVETFANAPARVVADPHARLRRAFEAVHELLGRLRDRAPLVLVIDDVQWIDRDSSQLLGHLLGRVDANPVLVVLCHRAEHHNEHLDSVLAGASTNRALRLDRLSLGPLSPEASECLAQQILDGRRDNGAMIERVGRESDGNPFLIREFAHFARHAEQSEALSLRAALNSRLDELPGAARKLALILGVAGQPLPLSVALQAAEATHTDLDALQGAHLVRELRRADDRRIELYHDRIGASLREVMPVEARRKLFAALALASEECAEIDADMRCAFLEGAGDAQRAASSAEQAAHVAVASLAFDHAARFYQKALKLGSYDRAHALHLTIECARALEYAGRSAESATAYARAASLESGDRQTDLQRHTAAQLLSAGHVAEGTALLDQLCARVGLRTSERRVDATALIERLLPALAKLDFSTYDTWLERTPPDIRVALLQIANFGLRYHYSEESALEVTLDYLLEAERQRDPWHIACALSSVVIHLDTKVDHVEVMDCLQQLAQRTGLPAFFAAANWVCGFAARRAGKNRDARIYFKKALTDCDGCVGMQWLVDLLCIFDQACANSCGDYADLSQSTARWADDAFQRGRVWTGAALSGSWGMPAWLVHDDAAGYRGQLARARGAWQQHAAYLTVDNTSFGLHRGEVMLSIYERVPLEGMRLLEQSTPSGRPIHRLGRELLRALCAAAILGGVRSGRQSAETREQASFVRLTAGRLHSSSTRPFAHVLNAACALHEQMVDDAVIELTSAARVFESRGMSMLAAGVNRRLGAWIGGSEGGALIRGADVFMDSQGVVNHEALTEFLCPGCERV